MKPTYFAILTAVGEAKLANATALGTTLKLTEMAVGDGAGELPMPDRQQTALINECRRAPLNTLAIDPDNANQLIAEQVIPEADGGWWIREIGLIDEDGDLCAVANCPPTYKPKLAEGAGRTQVIRLVLIVTSTAAVELKIDPSVVLATRQYVDRQLTDARQTFAPRDSPAFTGAPTAPTPPTADQSHRLATTDFVTQALHTKLDKSGDTVQGPLTVNPHCLLLRGLQSWVSEDGKITLHMRCATAGLEVLSEPGAEVIFRLQPDGRVWSPTLGFLDEVLKAKQPTGNYVRGAGAHRYRLNWDDRHLRAFVNDQYRGVLWTDQNFNPNSKADRDALNGKANAGWECQHNSGVWELAGIRQPVVDAPAPWIVVGMRSMQANSGYLVGLYLRVIKLRNQ